MQEIKIIPTQFNSEDETIVGNFVLPKGDGPYPGICKFHGLPGGPDQVSGIASSLAQAGFGVLTFDFRGFRRSEGLFSLRGRILDAEIAIDHLLEHPKIRKDWVGVYGASFGGPVSVCLATRDERVRAVCLRAPVYDTLKFAENPFFRNLPEEAYKEMAKGFRGMDDHETRNRILDQLIVDSKEFNPKNEIHKISPRPLFITTGTEDEAIDVEGVEDLFARAGEPKEFLLVEGADHRLSEQVTRTKTQEAIIAWFRKHAPT